MKKENQSTPSQRLELAEQAILKLHEKVKLLEESQKVTFDSIKVMADVNNRVDIADLELRAAATQAQISERENRSFIRTVKFLFGK